MDAQVLATRVRTQTVLKESCFKKIIQLHTVSEMFVRSPYTSRASGAAAQRTQEHVPPPHAAAMRVLLLPAAPVPKCPHFRSW